MCDSVRAPARKNNRCGSHESDRIGRANRSIRAQELSVVKASEFDLVPAPARNNNRCVSAKRSSHTRSRVQKNMVQTVSRKPTLGGR